MPTISITFRGVCLHLARGHNEQLPVPYRVIMPVSSRPVVLPGPLGADLGTLAPMISVNPVNQGDELSGPLVLSITGGVVGAPALPNEKPAPHLQPLAPNLIPEADLAYGTFPPNGSIYVDIAVPGTMTLQDDYMTFQATVDDLAISLQTAAGGSVTLLPVQQDVANTVSVKNDPAFPDNGSPAGADEALLGFLGVSHSIPANVRLLSDVGPVMANRARTKAGCLGWLFSLIEQRFGVDPSQPGCSNSQWP
ncbi:MAG TPA: hypothetical protein VGF48_00825 [Thermoanaerobaculia bacterium]|jgi:hypothetical protein